MRSRKLRFGIALSSALLFLTYCEKQNPVVEDLPRSIDTLKASPRSALLEVGQTLTITVKGGTKPYSYSSATPKAFQLISSSDSGIVVSPIDSGQIIINITDSSLPAQRDSVIIAAFFAGPTPITEDLFPLIVGRWIRYSGYLRHQTADTNITSSGAVYQTKWTVTVNSSVTPFGIAHVVNDSTRIPSGITNPPTLWMVSNLYLQRNSPTGSGNFSLLYNIGRFYKIFSIQRADSLRWVLVGKLDAGVGNRWTAFDSTWLVTISGVTTTARLEIIGKFEGRETLTLSGQTFNTYKLTLSQIIYLGGSTTPVAVGPIATVWLAGSIGPVKMILNADGENFGHYREFSSKNF